MVAVGAFGLLRDAFNAAMDAVPRGIDQAQVRAFLVRQAGVSAVHHLHIWSLGAGEIAMTAHLVRPGDRRPRSRSSTASVHELDHRFGINHPTLQIERGGACEHDRHDRAPHGDATDGSQEPLPAAILRGSLYFRRCKRGPEPAMISDIQKDAQTRMAKSVEALRHDLTKVRTGRASTALVDHLKVNYYGTDMPLTQVASIAVTDARSLTITPWEKQMVGPVEKAILASDLGLTPNTAGTVIRINLPALTEERRKELSKHVHGEGEDTKVAIRNIRRDANHQVKELLKDKQITEDEASRSEAEIQKLTDKAIKDVDEVVKAKEQELMAV